jgi:cytochrome c oxidase subunit IV
VRTEARVLLSLGLFFGVMDAVYWVWSKEDAGGVMIIAGTLLCFLPGFYYLWWSRRMRPRPEDDPHAEPSAGAGIVGTFPGTSIWPFTLGMAAFVVVLALVFGVWLLIPGCGLAFWALVGATSEGRRGGQH